MKNLEKDFRSPIHGLNQKSHLRVKKSKAGIRRKYNSEVIAAFMRGMKI